jgi:AcrR family transcriptional regulator
MSVSRTYKSPLREEQMEQTREKILETLAEILADESITDVSVAVVAERARISVRTAYRYFPTKEALFDEFNVWIRNKFGSPPLPTSVEELPELASQLFDYFQRNEHLMRATRSMPARELRKRRKGEQMQAVIKIVSKFAPNLDAETVKARAAVFLLMFGSEVWLNLRDHWGFDQQQMKDAVHWGLRTIQAQLADDNAKARKRK